MRILRIYGLRRRLALLCIETDSIRYLNNSMSTGNLWQLLGIIRITIANVW